MREPKIGETLRCGVCSKECEKIDQKWLDFFHKIEDKESLYDAEIDSFLSYCGCLEEFDYRRITGERENVLKNNNIGRIDKEEWDCLIKIGKKRW